jgi:hypothetical protein
MITQAIAPFLALGVILSGLNLDRLAELVSLFSEVLR